jgi:LPXTG-motif cell wall-anchored protein
MKLRILAATVTALVAGLLLSGTANAAHYTGPTKTVPWVTHLAPGGHIPPHDSADVTWPETLLVGPPKCGTVTQYDTYRYGTAQDRALVDALVAHGTLNRPNSGPWTDETFIVSWTLTVEAPCQAPSAGPSASPSPSSTPQALPPSGSGGVGAGAVTPVVPPTPSVPASPSATVTPIVLGETTTNLGETTMQLPNTGAPYLLLVGIGLGLIGTGGLLVAAARRLISYPQTD